MVTINLSQSGQGDEMFERRSFFHKGMIMSMVVIVLVAVIWVGAWFYLSRINKNIEKANAEIFTFQGGTSTDSEADKAADFKKRMDFVLGEPLAYNPDESLREMAKLVVRGAYVDTYEFDGKKKTLSVNLLCDNFEVMAQQIRSFKKSGYFSDITLEDKSGEKNEDGKVGLGFTMAIGPAAQNGKK